MGCTEPSWSLEQANPAAVHPLAVNALANQCCDGIIALEEGWRTGTGYQCSHTCVYHWCNDYRLQSTNRIYFGSMVPSEQRTNQTIFGTNMAQIVLSHSFQGPQQILTLTVVHSTDWEHMNMRWQVMLCHGVPMLGWIGWESSGYDHATLLLWQGQHVAVTCSDPKRHRLFDGNMPWSTFQWSMNGNSPKE